MLLRHIHADLPGARHDVRLDSPADVPTRGAHAADRAPARARAQRLSDTPGLRASAAGRKGVDSWARIGRSLARNCSSSAVPPTDASRRDRNCGMVPEPLLFQFGKYGVSLILSRLSLAECSISSSQFFAGALTAACGVVGAWAIRAETTVSGRRSARLDSGRLRA